MSLLGCESFRDSLKTWSNMTLSATFSGTSTVTDVVSDPPVVYTKEWNGGEEFTADLSWVRVHPSNYDIAHNYPAFNKFWVTNKCCCWICRFALTIQSYASPVQTTVIGTSPTEVSFRVPWIEYINGAENSRGTDQIYCRITPVNEIQSALANTDYYCNEVAAGRTGIKYNVIWTNNGVPWSFGGGGTGTSTRTYTGSDGGTGTGAWNMMDFGLTIGSGLGNANLVQTECCTNDQQTISGTVNWQVNKTSNAGYDYDSVCDISLTVALELE